jgi:hypothetical protein
MQALEVWQQKLYRLCFLLKKKQMLEMNLTLIV